MDLLHYNPAGALQGKHGLLPEDLSAVRPNLEQAREEVLADAELWASGGEVPAVKLEQTSAAVANMYYVGAINRIGSEDDFGDNDYYGSSYFADPRGQFIEDKASDQDAELVIREFDLEMVEAVRNGWAFYRDRRPDTYGPLVEA